MQSKFPDDVSGVAVGPIFNGYKLERKWAVEWDATLYRGGVGVGRVCSVQKGPIRFEEDLAKIVWRATEPTDAV